MSMKRIMIYQMARQTLAAMAAKSYASVNEEPMPINIKDVKAKLLAIGLDEEVKVIENLQVRFKREELCSHQVMESRDRAETRVTELQEKLARAHWLMYLNATIAVVLATYLGIILVVTS
jgi:hypothetical protein